MKFSNKLKVQLPLALGLSLISNYSMRLPVLSAEQLTTAPSAVNNGSIASNTVSPKPVNVNTVAIRNIYVNENKQLVIEFDNPAHLSPVEPQLRDYPGQKHDIVLEFPQTSFAVDKTPKAKAVLDELMKFYPELNSLSYATASDGTKSRIRIGVSPNVSAQPSLAKIDQASAVINLTLSETNKTPSASNNGAVDEKNPVVDTSKSAPKDIRATDASASSTPDSEKGIKAKTVNSIKDAWTSSLNAGKNLGKIASINPFGHNKPTNKQSAPANTDITTTASNEKTATSVKQGNAAQPVAAPQSIPNSGELAASNSSVAIPVATAPVKSPTSVPAMTETAAVTTPTSVSESSSAKDILLTPAINPVPANTSVTSDPNSAVATLKPEITGPEVAPASKDNQLAAMGVNKTIESTNSELPKIPASSVENKASDEPVITPLSVEQVLKEKANLEAANPKPPISVADNTPSQPVSTESKTADNSFASDFKTSFSKPVDESTDKKDVAEKPNDEKVDKKDVAAKPEEKVEKTEKLASVPPNPLDSLTSAAISNAGSEPESEGDAQMSAAVKLKAQRAHVGGQNYFPPKFDDEAVDHYNAAVRAHLNGKLTEAITEYKAAIEADGKIAEAYSNLGLIYNQLHKYDLAMVEFHKALALSPKDAITYNGIGAAMRAKNNLLAAIKNWQTAITLDPNLASAHYNLGTAYEINKDLEKALAQYKEAVKHDDKLGEAYYRMGLILQKMNNKNLALEEYEQAIKISQQASYVTDAKRRINLLSQSKNNAM